MELVVRGQESLGKVGAVSDDNDDTGTIRRDPRSHVDVSYRLTLPTLYSRQLDLDTRKLSRSYTAKRTNVIAMTAMPMMKLVETTVSAGSYLRAVGSNSLMQMMTIIPATIPNKTP